MKKPTLSIIIPMFNTGDSTIKLINTILVDIYKDLEIIVVDDGSKDDSLEKVKSIKSEKINLFHQDNSGASSARNFGIKKAKGEYIIFLDSDDSIAPNFISSLIQKIQQPNTDLVTTGKLYRRLGTKMSKNLFLVPVPKQTKKETFKTYILKLLSIDGRLYSVNNKIFKSKIIKDNNLLFDTAMNFAEDTKFVLEYLNHSVGNIDFIYEPLYIYNFGTDTSTVKTSSLDWANWQKSYNHLKQWVGNHPNRTERVGLKKIYLRWKISHALAVARSKQNFKQKSKYLNPVSLLAAEFIVKFRR